ncbi:phage head closure protein [Pseudomonas paraversuta]|uniref:phage head closure protein n=1 Tax=Pseudomonas paraversuta TaxID=2750624 RepID=UPI0019323199|nr:phage head closure protein [Pseudomonas paraversuta]
MRAGDLRHPVVIQHQSAQQDPATGEMTTIWLDYARVWAAVDPLSARDLIAAQASQSQASGRITIRYRPGVLPTMRILHRGQVFTIIGQPLPDRNSGLEYLTLVVATGVNDG